MSDEIGENQARDGQVRFEPDAVEAGMVSVHQAKRVAREEVKRLISDQATANGVYANKEGPSMRQNFDGSRWLLEGGIVFGALVVSKSVDPALIGGFAYAVTQSVRAAIALNNNPLKNPEIEGTSPARLHPDGTTSVLTTNPFGRDRQITKGSEIFHEQQGKSSSEKRRTAYVMKGLAVGATSIYLSLGAPFPGASEQSAAQAPAAEASDSDSVASTQPSTGEEVSSLNYECEASVTPIPMSPEQVSALDEYESVEYSGYVETYQKLLKAVGLYAGEVDGIAGPMTQSGTEELKARLSRNGMEGLTDSGVLTTEDCIVFQQSGVWRYLIDAYTESRNG